MKCDKKNFSDRKNPVSGQTFCHKIQSLTVCAYTVPLAYYLSSSLSGRTVQMWSVIGSDLHK